MGKLTKAQADLLRDLVRDGRATCVDTYPPAKRLVALGYAHWSAGLYGYRPYPTPAGRAALNGGA